MDAEIEGIETWESWTANILIITASGTWLACSAPWN